MHTLMLLHYGGTIGMVEGPDGYRTLPGNLRNIICSNPNISSESVCTNKTNFRNSTSLKSKYVAFTTPSLRNDIVVGVDYLEFPTIKDSSKASVEDFCAIAKTIEIFYDEYDGFVVVHGTDTLSYAAAFLSFMTEQLTVPIVLTGAQIPMMAKGSDGESNLVGAIESCCLVESPGVYLYFNGWLHHGARATKISTMSFDTFFSTNPIRIEDLAKKYIKCETRGRKRKEKPHFYFLMSDEIGIFKVFPSIRRSHLQASLSAYKAVILETYGAGHFPTNRRDLLELISDYIVKGGVVVNVSQCADGSVDDRYEPSNVLANLGVLSARNITSESAYAKLSLLVANNPYEIKELFPVSLRGEIDENADTAMFKFNNCSDFQ